MLPSLAFPLQPTVATVKKLVRQSSVAIKSTFQESSEQEVGTLRQVHNQKNLSNKAAVQSCGSN